MSNAIYLHLSQHGSNDPAPPPRIVVHRNQQPIIPCHHIQITFRINPIHINGTAALDIDRIRLTRRVVITITQIITIKERPESSSVEEKIRRRGDILKPSHPALRISASTVRVIGISVGRDECRCPRSRIENVSCKARSLPVRRLRLLHTSVNVFCVVEIVLVQSVVFKSCAD